MTSLLLAFFTSFIAAILIIRTQKLHGGISGDKDFDGPQKFHTAVVPRIGGLAIGLGLFASISINYQSSADGMQKILMLFCAIPAFGIGLTEDLTKKVSVRIRLIFTAFGALLAEFYACIKFGIPLHPSQGHKQKDR